MENIICNTEIKKSVKVWREEGIKREKMESMFQIRTHVLVTHDVLSNTIDHGTCHQGLNIRSLTKCRNTLKIVITWLDGHESCSASF